jgi:transcriptional regulator with XRE-family HTH domain
MSRFLQIRNLLDLNQTEVAEVLQCTQPNVSLLDRGQTITPASADKLISAAHALGVPLTWGHVYGKEPLPMKPRPKPAPATVEWRTVCADLFDAGWSCVLVAARLGVRIATVRALACGEMLDPPHAIGAAMLLLRGSGERPQVAQHKGAA